MSQKTDEQYLQIIVNRILVSKEYKPAFGRKQKVTLSEFQQLYRSDPFYNWFGLDDDLIYAAHRVAGGMTSVYRQIGLGCEELFRQILQDYLELTLEQTKWTYKVTVGSNQVRKLSLDARINLLDITSLEKRKIIEQWLRQAAKKLDVSPEIAQILKGIVFEVRQGYKSKDSKRQNADIANAATAYTQGYLPVLIVLSNQIDYAIVDRYQQAKWLILSGKLSSTSFESTYTFTKEIIGYDLANFFKRQSPILQTTISNILHILLGQDFTHG